MYRLARSRNLKMCPTADLTDARHPLGLWPKSLAQVIVYAPHVKINRRDDNEGEWTWICEARLKAQVSGS